MGLMRGPVKSPSVFSPNRNMSLPIRTESLERFGAAAERREHVAIGVGGEVVLGATASGSSNPGKEEECNESAGSERPAWAAPWAAPGPPAGDGPAAGSWSGRRAPSEAAACPAAHALRELTDAIRRRFGDWKGNGITEREFEELAKFFPDVRVSASSSRFLYLTLTASPFPELGERFRLVFEVPHPRFVTDVVHRPVYVTRHDRGGARAGAQANRLGVRSAVAADELLDLLCASLSRGRRAFRLFPRLRSDVQLVPAIRAWARWETGPMAGTPIISHHRQPDLSICACIPYQWVRGRDAIVDYAGMTVCWLGKVLHEQTLGWYPGLQHYPEWMRRERDRPNEFCGCGAPERYGSCHRDSDQALSGEWLRDAERSSRIIYFDELARERRPMQPPDAAWEAS